MGSLIFIGGACIGGVVGSIALLVRVIAGRRISLGRGLAVVIVACLAWHALAWFGLSCTNALVHSIFFLSVIIPFGYGFGDGAGAAGVAITIQAVLATAFAAVVYWWLRRGPREQDAAPLPSEGAASEGGLA